MDVAPKVRGILAESDWRDQHQWCQYPADIGGSRQTKPVPLQTRSDSGLKRWPQTSGATVGLSGPIRPSKGHQPSSKSGIAWSGHPRLLVGASQDGPTERCQLVAESIVGAFNWPAYCRAELLASG